MSPVIPSIIFHISIIVSKYQCFLFKNSNLPPRFKILVFSQHIKRNVLRRSFLVFVYRGVRYFGCVYRLKVFSFDTEVRLWVCTYWANLRCFFAFVYMTAVTAMPFHCFICFEYFAFFYVF